MKIGDDPEKVAALVGISDRPVVEETRNEFHRGGLRPPLFFLVSCSIFTQ